MNLLKIENELSSNEYPGRGILVGKSKDGTKAVIAYFIMGRSENSRNRIFVEKGCGIRTQAFDESKLTDPSLIIYSPVKVLGENTIVTNGDQTDTVYTLMNENLTFEQSLKTREFEPDAPNFTPRISSIVTRLDGDMEFSISILKSANNNPASCQRYTFNYSTPLNGEARFIHTYKCDGDPLPSFEGEPKLIKLDNQDIEEFSNMIWDNLNKDNKISLFTRYIDLKTGKTESKIINKNK